METLKVSLMQINIEYEKPELNLNKVERFIQNLPDGPNHIILLPELWSTGFTPNLEIAIQKNKEVVELLSSKSTNKNIIIGGTFISKDKNGNFYNTFKLIFPNNFIVNYHKIHLFSQMNEVLWFTPGTCPVIAENKINKIGLSVCYDLRFPELFRIYSKYDVNICLLPAQWPKKRIDHFIKLSTARAIENQFFFAAANTVGKIGNTIFGGSSLIIDPLGNPLLQCSTQEEEIQSIVIDITQVDDVRKSFPVLSDKVINDTMQPIIEVAS